MKKTQSGKRGRDTREWARTREAEGLRKQGAGNKSLITTFRGLDFILRTVGTNEGLEGLKS